MLIQSDCSKSNFNASIYVRNVTSENNGCKTWCCRISNSLRGGCKVPGLPRHQKGATKRYNKCFKWERRICCITNWVREESLLCLLALYIYIFDKLYQSTNSIIVVITPLTAIINDQVSKSKLYLLTHCLQYHKLSLAIYNNYDHDHSSVTCMHHLL